MGSDDDNASDVELVKHAKKQVMANLRKAVKAHINGEEEKSD